MDQKFNYAHDTNWRIFRIMAEFVEGFTFLSQFDQTVTFFGSAVFPQDNPYCIAARELANRLATDGYTVITGGGPGIMEAANHGAYEANGESVGINIQIPTEQRTNPWVKKSEAFNYFYTRKVMMAFSAQAYIYFPGGFGTLDELFELLNLEKTKKIEQQIPIILYGSDFWQPLVEWMHRSLAQHHQTLTETDLKLLDLVDTIEDAYQIIKSVGPRTIHPFSVNDQYSHNDLKHTQ